MTFIWQKNYTQLCINVYIKTFTHLIDKCKLPNFFKTMYKCKSFTITQSCKSYICYVYIYLHLHAQHWYGVQK